MNNILKIISIFAFAISCKAQNPIINIEDADGKFIPGAYFRDTNNLLDPFVGTYIYTDGTTTLKIVLQKKNMYFYNKVYYDLIIGEYQYINNGVEKINTLSNLDFNYSGHYSIKLRSIVKKGSYRCPECSIDEIRIAGSIIESSTHNTAELLIGRTIVNGQPAIVINMYWRTRIYVPDVDPAPIHASFPGGEYVLLKQP